MTLSVRPQDEMLIVRLKSLMPPPEFREETLAKLHSEGKVALAGFVSDASTGGPLAGVRVTSAGQSSETNPRGFFALSMALPKTYSVESGALVELQLERSGYRTLLRRNVRLTTTSVRKYRLTLKRGSGTDVMDELARVDEPNAAAPDAATSAKPGAGRATPPTLPATVRVGRDCATSTTCKVVEVTNLEDYVKHVLPKEWIAAWHAESLKAGSVAIRSVGVWFANNPKTSTYDVCDNTACQKYDPDVSEEATDKATDSTAKKVLVKTGTSTVVKSEYSAENNDAGCGDGKSGNGTTAAPCIDDIVCESKTTNGHGRGMCQWGSQRWATGKTAAGSPAPGGSKNMTLILSHYYPNYQAVEGR
jgi:hypothetical protein